MQHTNLRIYDTTRRENVSELHFLAEDSGFGYIYIQYSFTVGKK